MVRVVPAISSPFNKNRKLITPTYKKPEEERLAAEKAKEERLAALKAEEERLAALKAEEERLAAEKAEEMQRRTQSLEERLQSLVDTSTFVDEVFAEMEEEPIPRTQEEIVHMPNIHEEIVHMPNIQEEIVHMPNIIQHEPRLGTVSPMTPDKRSFS